MDYIIDKLNEGIEINDKDSYNYVTYQRERIEYLLFFALGYLWNKNSAKIEQDVLCEITTSMYRMSIGTVVSNIRKLDIDKEILNKKVSKVFNDYPNLRNSKIGHGYSTSEEIIQEFSACYLKLVEEIPLFKKNITIIVVEDETAENYNGLRLPFDMHGRKERWTCPKDIFKEDKFPSTYALIDGVYYKLSPFVLILNRAQQEYILSSLEDTLSGNAKMCPLFGSDEINFSFSELSIPSRDSNNRIISLVNNTIRNNYEENFQIYHEVGVKKLVYDFLYNESSVSATIWGHGGVGKTACIQNICQELFCDKEQKFSYIIFVTAKDRVYKSSIGKIVKNEGNYIRSYKEIIHEIIKTIFDQELDLSDEELLKSAEQMIITCKQKSLIIIDDYETFADCEKEKINLFIQQLSIKYHKVVITTRNTRFVVGQKIPTNELNQEETKKFLIAVFTEKYQAQLEQFLQLLEKNDYVMDKIFAATSGRPIFIYQFVFLYVQEGYNDTIMDRLKNSSDAIEFLYGRLYMYLSDDAKILFLIISQIINEELIFRIDILSYISSKAISNEIGFEVSLEELYEQKIIEQYADSQARVYSTELVKIMQDHFSHKDDAFKSTVLNLLNSIGGKNINGSIQEALLNEADRSRIGGNCEDTVSRYRRVLKSDAPYYIRKKALMNVASYLTISNLDAVSASNIIEEYLETFKDDYQVNNQYVDYLWQQEGGKKKAYLFLRDFFGIKKGHKKNDVQYFNLFSKAVGYCTNYDMSMKKYETDELRMLQYKKTVNEYGKLLFEYINDGCFQYGKKKSKHFVKIGLLQTLKMCVEIPDDENIKNLAIKICEYADANFDDKIYHNQFMVIGKKVNYCSEQNWIEIDKRLKNHNTFLAEIKCIKKYGVFLKFDLPIQGFIHISELQSPIETYCLHQKINVEIIQAEREKYRISMKQVY